MATLRRSGYGRVFYAHSDIWRFRGVKRLSDYLKIEGRLLQPDRSADTDAPRGWNRLWRALTSDKALTIMLVLIGVAMLIVVIL